ncbi:hypothetical protein [Mycobacterium sp. C31M]
MRIDPATPAPDSVNPSLWRVVALNGEAGLYEVTDGIYQLCGLDLANMTVVEGEHGIITRGHYGTVSHNAPFRCSSRSSPVRRCRDDPPTEVVAARRCRHSGCWSCSAVRWSICIVNG